MSIWGQVYLYVLSSSIPRCCWLRNPQELFVNIYRTLRTWKTYYREVFLKNIAYFLWPSYSQTLYDVIHVNQSNKTLRRFSGSEKDRKECYVLVEWPLRSHHIDTIRLQNVHWKEKKKIRNSDESDLAWNEGNKGQKI